MENLTFNEKYGRLSNDGTSPGSELRGRRFSQPLTAYPLALVRSGGKSHLKKFKKEVRYGI